MVYEDRHAFHFYTFNTVSNGNYRKVKLLFQSAEVLYKAIFDSARFTVIATDLEGLIYYCNQYAVDLLGYSKEELIGKVTPALIHDIDEVAEQSVLLSAELGFPVSGFEVFVAKARLGEPAENRWTYLSKQGERIPVLLSVTQINDEQGNICGFLGIAKDIREVEHLKLLNQEGEERFRRLTDAAFEAIAVTCDGLVIDCNDQCTHLLSCAREDIVGQPMMMFVAPDSRALVAQRIADDYQQVYKIELVRSDGGYIPVEVSGRTAFWDNREVRITAVRDVRDRRELELKLAEQKRELQEKNRQLKHLAMHDELTGIANRRSGVKYLSELLRAENLLLNPISVLMIDVDYFKKLNDQYGHNAGDQALQQLAKELSSQLRAQDLLVRWGGEEFLCVLPSTSISAASVVAEKLRSMTQRCSKSSTPLTVSIGVASTENGIVHQDQLLSCADHALYAAKGAGRNCVVSDPGWT